LSHFGQAASKGIERSRKARPSIWEIVAAMVTRARGNVLCALRHGSLCASVIQRVPRGVSANQLWNGSCSVATAPVGAATAVVSDSLFQIDVADHPRCSNYSRVCNTVMVPAIST
jgi:hypothetical protein